MSGILLVVCTAGLSILFVLQIRAFKAIQRWHRSLPEPFILPLTGLVLGVADALRWPSLHIISYRLLSLLYAVICLLYVTDGYHAGLLLVGADVFGLVYRPAADPPQA